MMETIKYPFKTTARKDHKCDFCCEKISIGEVYVKSVQKYEGLVYDWKSHLHCSELVQRLNMYDDEDGVTQDSFQERISDEHFNVLLSQISMEDVKKYSDIIQQLRLVQFKHKLSFVLHYYKRLDKTKTMNKYLTK